MWPDEHEMAKSEHCSTNGFMSLAFWLQNTYNFSVQAEYGAKMYGNASCIYA